jgi:hypothetical protein
LIFHVIADGNILEDMLDGQDVVLPVRRLADDGLEAWQQALAHSWEGLVAKAPQSLDVGGRKHCAGSRRT